MGRGGHRGVVSVLALAGGLALGMAVRRRRPFRVAVRGPSMAPTLAAGDFLVAVDRRGRVIRRGTLVVLEHPGRRGFELVKRVAALPGESVGGRRLAADEVWVAGDRSDASTDSRSFGPVPLSALRGVVRLRYWPPSRARRFP